jgi:CBS domain-containing protein
MNKTNSPRAIEDRMTEYPTIATGKMTVTEAIDLMKSTGIRHLPIVRNGVIQGVISERDLKQAEILSDAMTLLVCDVMTPNPYCVLVGTPLAEVARDMARQKIGCAIVLNSRATIVGIFTTTDGMRVLAEVLSQPRGTSSGFVTVEEALGTLWMT